MANQTGLSIEVAIGYTFVNKKLLAQALTHSSLGVGMEKDNTTLAFLGSAAMQFVVAKELFTHHLETAGKMSKIRDNVNSKATLAEIALSLNIRRHLLASATARGEFGGEAKAALEAAVQALIGAILLDGGYFAVEEFAKRFLFPRISEGPVKDPKTLLQEAMRTRMGKNPTYRLISVIGPDHDQHFLVGVYLDGRLLAEGEGSTKKDAEKDAAQKALDP